jgi:hypothetical protein
VTEAFEERFNPPIEPAGACFDVMPLAVLTGTSAGSALEAVPWFPADAFESFTCGAAELELLRLKVLCHSDRVGALLSDGAVLIAESDDE